MRGSCDAGPSGAEAWPLRALVVDQDAMLGQFLQLGLGHEGFTVATARDGPAALAMADRFHPDVVILDILVPGLAGLEVCRRLRARQGLAIVILTADSGVAARIAGLDAGADDYVCKPFRFQELLARLRAVLRGRNVVARQMHRAGGVILDHNAHEVTREGRRVALTVREFALLDLMLGHPGRVFTREAIANRLWGYAVAGESNVIDVHIRSLREKLGDKPPTLIRTIRGIGYVFRA